MTPEQFCYWLQGAFETMDEGRGLSSFDHTVRDHLKTVFDKKTPEYHMPPMRVPEIEHYPKPLENPITHPNIIC